MSPKLCPAENTGPLRGDHDPEGVAVAGAAQRLGEREHHIDGQGVALLGTVERDGDDVAVALDEHC